MIVSQSLTSLVRREQPVSVVRFRVFCQSRTPFTVSTASDVTGPERTARVRGQVQGVLSEPDTVHGEYSLWRHWSGENSPCPWSGSGCSVRAGHRSQWVQPLTSLVRREQPVSVVRFRVFCQSRTPFTVSTASDVTGPERTARVRGQVQGVLSEPDTVYGECSLWRHWYWESSPCPWSGSGCSVRAGHRSRWVQPLTSLVRREQPVSVVRFRVFCQSRTLEVFTGPIFSPNSSPPHEPGSKSIPAQIQNLMGQPPPIHIKVRTVFTRAMLKY